MSKEKPIRKKLIEVALPLEAINKASAREKSIRHGHPSTLHLWWARRPLAACRAVLFGQLVDDPSAWPDKFKGEEAQEAERQRLFRIIEKLVLWENSTNEDVLNAARWEIARSVAWGLGEQPPKQGDGKAILAYLQEKAPPVYDPFCGGGSIPLEAQRLGLRAYGSDLNPVAVLISKALVEIPPKFAGMPPVNPEARQKLSGSGKWNGKGAQGLAEDVRYYGNWMRNEAESRIGHLYPQVEVTDDAIREQPSLEPLRGQKLTVIAWLWARTVASPNPAAKGAHVPLVSTFMLSSRDGKQSWVSPVSDIGATDGYRFDVKSGTPSQIEEETAKAGTVKRSGGGVCILTNTAMPFAYLRAEGSAGRMKKRLMAIVAEGERGRVYLPASAAQSKSADVGSPAWTPEGEISHWPGRTNVVEYGMKEFQNLFTARQLVTLTTFSDLVGEARKLVIEDARSVDGLGGGRLNSGSVGAEGYADAVASYLSLSVSKLADYNSSLVVWSPTRDQAKSTFARQALPMVWDFAEVNVFGKAAGDLEISLRGICRSIDELHPGGHGEIQQAVAQNNNYPASNVCISTDPPYYDNIGYADLSDFFYTWLRRSLQSVHPKLFATVVVPKAEELVASPYRHGGKENADDFFLLGMKRAIGHIAAISSAEIPIAIYYAFKQSDTDDEGVSSTGWATFLQAISDSNLMIDGTLPIRTERAERSISIGSNALASSIVLVCRRRAPDAAIATRAAFLSALKRELPAALKLLQAGNIAPVDLAQASIGPGMGIFTRHSKVLEADDSEMSVKTALQLINQALDDFLSEQESEYDAETRYAITWFETHGMESSAYGDAETLAKARNVAVAGVADAGLLESKGGKVRLLKRSELESKWDPLTDKTLTVWECAQHLIRVLEADGETVAAGLLGKLGSRADATRDLAYRLYQICERKKWADEARAYNGLVVAWPELQKLASQQASVAPQTPAQAELL